MTESDSRLILRDQVILNELFKDGPDTLVNAKAYKVPKSAHLDISILYHSTFLNAGMFS